MVDEGPHPEPHSVPLRTLRLVTFGGLALETVDGSPPPRARPQRLAILAVVASAGDRGVSRERLAGLLWPDMDEQRARHSLRQALYAMRQELGVDALLPETVLALDRSLLSSDIGDFRAALASGDRARAAEVPAGPFLQGFYLPDAPEFERWVEEERAALTAEATRVTLSLANAAAAAGEHDASVEWWRRLTVLDPLSGHFALGYLKVLAARGDRAGALAFARAHESVVRRELEADADPEIRRLESALRALPSPSVVRPASAPPATPYERAPVVPEPPPSVGQPGRTRWTRRPLIVAGAVALVAIAAALTASRWRPAVGLGTRSPTFAVGMIREEGVPDTLRIGGVLTDMLATNLARIAGLSVLANSRLFELMRPGQDTLLSGYSEAARRAGASEIFQGRLLSGPQWSLALEIQRVDLSTGLVKGAYRVAADDRYALVDSMTAAIARDLRVVLPRGSVADATTDSPVAYRLYEEGLRAFFQYDDATALRLMKASLEEDSTFAMAAYYVARLRPGAHADETAIRNRALRLAARLPERERLTVTAELLAGAQDPSAVSVAESLTTRYAGYPRSYSLLADALGYAGDTRGAVAALERAIALDSVAEPSSRQDCRLCADYSDLADQYLAWDSLPAAERTARRFIRARPQHHKPYDILARVAAARGDTAALHAHLREFDRRNIETTPRQYGLWLKALAEEYDDAGKGYRELLATPRRGDEGGLAWALTIVLRNQGRLREALRLTRATRRLETTARYPQGSELSDAVMALELGDPRTAVAIFTARAGWDESAWAPGIRARHHSWHYTLLGMALAAAGDTVGVLRLADSVEYWGRRSLYARDRNNARYLRGLVFAAAKRDSLAATEFRAAIYSPTNGFTRINVELGRTLLRLDRAAEAVPVVRAGLHGGLDGSNLYNTRTELHELLGQAYDRLSMRDSAAVHFRAVVKAWDRADPVYHARRDRARAWLARNHAVPR